MENNSKKEKEKMINISKVNRDRYMRELEGIFKIYISTIPSKDMTSSLEAISSILILLDQLNPKSILDLGSGFGSVAFRWYFLKNPVKKNVKLLSVDTDPLWLKKTKWFCQNAYLPLYDFATWFEILEMVEPFDIIFINFEFSKDYTTIFNNFVDENTIVVFDNEDKDSLLINNWMEQFHPKEVNIEDLTKYNKRYCRLFYEIKKSNIERPQAAI